MVEGGIGRATENEDAVNPVAARAYLERPSDLLGLDLPVMHTLKECEGWGPRARKRAFPIGVPIGADRLLRGATLADARACSGACR